MIRSVPVQKPIILTYSRSFLVDSFRANVAPLADTFDFRFLTDGTHGDTLHTRTAFYAALASGARSEALTGAEQEDVVRRCRLLRNLDRNEAYRLMHAMTIALEAALDLVRPAGILAQMVDDYSNHILSLLAERRGIGYLGFCPGYFPGRSLLLADAHGRPYEWREAEEEEVEQTVEIVSQRAFRQTYNLRLEYRFPTHLFNVLRHRVKQVVYWLRGRIERDPQNFHYRVTSFMADRRRVRDFPFPSYFCGNWEDRLRELREARPDAPIVYMPLGYFPESTIDYWVLNKRALDYERLVLEMARTLGRDCILLVKEHLHMMGSRAAEFLTALRDTPGTISVPPLEYSNAVVDAADAVIVGGGSPGIEARLRGKAVFSFCDTSYWFESANAEKLDLDDIDTWPAKIRRGLEHFESPGQAELHRFVKHCLRSSTRVDPRVTLWPLHDPADLKRVLIKIIGDRAPLRAEQRLAS